MKFASTSLFALACLASTACHAEERQSFIGTPWKIGQLNNDSHFADGLGTITFSQDGNVSAFGGCNMMGGTYTYSNAAISVGPMMATRMACMPDKKMQDEQALGDALGKGPFDVKESAQGVSLVAKDGTSIQLVPADNGEGDDSAFDHEEILPETVGHPQQ